jgi:hypothetical protein
VASWLYALITDEPEGTSGANFDDTIVLSGGRRDFAPVSFHELTHKVLNGNAPVLDNPNPVIIEGVTELITALAMPITADKLHYPTYTFLASTLGPTSQAFVQEMLTNEEMYREMASMDQVPSTPSLCPEVMTDRLYDVAEDWGIQSRDQWEAVADLTEIYCFNYGEIAQHFFENREFDELYRFHLFQEWTEQQGLSWEDFVDFYAPNTATALAWYDYGSAVQSYPWFEPSV